MRSKVDNSVYMIEVSNPRMPNQADRLHFAKARVFVEHRPPCHHDGSVSYVSLVLGEWFRPKQLRDACIGMPEVSAETYEPADGSLWAANAIVPTNLCLAPGLKRTSRSGRGVAYEKTSQIVIHTDVDLITKNYRAIAG